MSSNSFNLYNQPREPGPFHIPVLQMKKDTEGLGVLPKVSQLVSGRARIQTQAVCCREWPALHSAAMLYRVKCLDL